MSRREFYVIEFKDPPVLDLDRYICVPSTWSERPFHDLSPRSLTVVVKYPLEKIAVTKGRVKRFEDYADHWKMYIATVKYTAESYKDALAYIKLLSKSVDPTFEQHSEKKSDSNTPHNSSQSKARPTDTRPTESRSDPQGSSYETPRSTKTYTKTTYNRESQNRGHSSAEHESENNAPTCETETEDTTTLKQDLLGFFDKFLPIVERFEANIAQNSFVLEKILTIIVDKFNRPNIDESNPTASTNATETNAKGRENGNITTTVQGNSGTAIDPIASTSKDTTPVAMEEEVDTSSGKQVKNTDTIEDPKTNYENVDKADRFATNIAQHSIVLEKILNILEEKFHSTNLDETVPKSSRDATGNNAGERETGNITNALQRNIGTGDDPIPATSQDTTLIAEAMEVVETRSENKIKNTEPSFLGQSINPDLPVPGGLRLVSETTRPLPRSPLTEENTYINSYTIQEYGDNDIYTVQGYEDNENNTKDRETHDSTMSNVENPTAGDNGTVDIADTENSNPERPRNKRKLADADSHVPMKKRDGPRNPTLQNRQNVSGEINSGIALPVESTPANTSETMIPLTFLTFINDAFKVSSLYKRN